jgi:hypothetical protein
MSKSGAWILGKSYLDSLLILFPGLAGAALSRGLAADSTAFLLYAFFAVTLIDSGHVYTTVWRTIFRREERRSHPIYWLAPLLVFTGAALWIWCRAPYLWTFVVYATVFHHITQFYGFLCWYQRLNTRTCWISRGLLYALLILPFLLLHVRSFPAQKIILYADRDILFFPHSGLLHAGLIGYGLVAAAWLVFEVRLLLRGIHEWNRMLAILGPALLYAWCFLRGRSTEEIILPLLLAHGIPYMAVMGLSLTRLNPSRFGSMAVACGAVIATAAVFGSLEWLYEEYVVDVSNDYLWIPTSLGYGLLVGAYLVPTLCHYIFDGRIWKGRHREARLIYGAGSNTAEGIPPLALQTPERGRVLGTTPQAT